MAILVSAATKTLLSLLVASALLLQVTPSPSADLQSPEAVLTQPAVGLFTVTAITEHCGPMFCVRCCSVPDAGIVLPGART